MEPELSQIEKRFDGRLVVEAKLGQGGMGAVYRVQWNGITAALKVLPGSAFPDSAAMRRFLLEGQILGKLSHRNIIRVHEIGETPDFPYILCEYVEGESLDVLAAREAPLPWDRALAIAEQILEGLAAAHAADIIHRDIKPSNVLMGAGDAVKLADFGIAKAAKMESKHTTTGIIVGTPAYISPEVLEGGKATPRSDVFSTGVLLYELITGRLPWNATEAGALLTERITIKEAPRPSRHRPELPRSLDGFLAVAMAPRPVDRYPTANTFRAAIASTRKQLMTSVGSPSSTMRMPSSPKGRGTRPRVRTLSELDGAPPPPRLPSRSQRSAIEVEQAGDRRWAHVVVAVFALLASVTVWAIHRTRTGVAAASSSSPRHADLELEGPPPTGAERRVYDDLRLGTGNVLAAAIERASRTLGADRLAQLIYRAWGVAGPQQEKALRDSLAGQSHPLAVPALVKIMQDPSPGTARRIEAASALADRIQELAESAFPPESFPRREAIASALCDLLWAATMSPEEPAVRRAAVRALGWLADPATSVECFQGMEAAQSDDAAAEPLVREALARYQSEPARSRAARVLQEMRRTRSPAGLAGPAPVNPRR